MRWPCSEGSSDFGLEAEAGVSGESLRGSSENDHAPRGGAV